MSERLGFGRQIHWTGTCARYAVRHALLCVGITTTEREVSAGLGKGRLRGFWGLDEERIKRALHSHGCREHEVYEESARATRQLADAHLADRLPLIVCVEDWEHWAVVCGRKRNRYAVIDSATRRLFGDMSWRDLRRWLHCDGEDAPYYLIAVAPRRGRPASLVPSFPDLGERLRRHRRLRRRWGTYLGLLRRTFHPDRALDMSARAFFDDRGEELLRRSAVSASCLSGLRAVAEAHQLRIASSQVEPALDELCAAVRASR